MISKALSSITQAARIGMSKVKTTTAQERKDQRESTVLQDVDRHFNVLDHDGSNGALTRSELQSFSEGDYDRDAAEAKLQEAGVAEGDFDTTLNRLERRATTLVNNNALFDRLDVANDPGQDTDGKISRGDLIADQFAIQRRLALRGHSLGTDNTGLSNTPFAVPTEATESVYREGEPDRDLPLAERQEETVLRALSTGNETTFTNALGEREQISLRQIPHSGDEVEFEFTDGDGRTINITSELPAEQTRVALARLIDYHTQTPEQFRGNVDRIEFHADGKSSNANAGADFNANEDRIRFFYGLDNLNESVYDHEVAHGIGYQVDGIGDSIPNRFGNLFIDTSGRGAPQGWQDAIDADSQAISEYAHTNIKEDFAESWAAYVEAREVGALEDFKAAYPNRFEILESVYEAS